MTPAEMFIISIVYVASLLLSQRVAAVVVPDFQEIAFLVAGAGAMLTAGWMYYRRERRVAPAVVPFSVGAVCALLALVVGMAIQLVWQPIAYPMIALPLVGVVTLLLPFALFPLARGLKPDTRAQPSALAAIHIWMAVAIAFVMTLAAIAVPAPARSNVKLAHRTFPGIEIELPDWSTEEENASFESGSIRLTDPGQEGKFLSFRWTDSDPVQTGEYVSLITGTDLKVKSRDQDFIAGHEGAEFYLESSDGSERAYATIWNCPQDHRVLWVLSNLSGPKGNMEATHKRVVSSVRCHTGTGAPTTQKVFPSFVPPPGFTQNPLSKSRMYLGPKHETIVLDAGVPGRSRIVDATLSPEMVETILKSTGALTTVDGPAQMRTVPDLSGHQRRVWSATGTNSNGKAVQVEVMVWYCDTRDLTFIGGYATEGKHDPSEGINALLPAICHVGSY